MKSLILGIMEAVKETGIGQVLGDGGRAEHHSSRQTNIGNTERNSTENVTVSYEVKNENISLGDGASYSPVINFPEITVNIK